ncbi:MAG TPA: crossover junction endodeoxyribonuclease RuvC [Dehalococcoidia bacterium]|nr:crossover junction endodeoxyribonuclease RuvC [Dehalococcoidia bacterium]
MSPSGPVTILGIDPGLNVTGYGVIIADGSSHKAIDFGAIRPPSDAPLPERLLRLHEGLINVIDEHRPREVAIEDFITGYARSSVAVGEARAAASLAAARSALPVAFYKPSEVKQFVTSYGRGSKDQVALMIQALLHLSEPPTPADAADALAVAVCHALKRGGNALRAASAAARARGSHAQGQRR